MFKKIEKQTQKNNKKNKKRKIIQLTLPYSQLQLQQYDHATPQFPTQSNVTAYAY